MALHTRPITHSPFIPKAVRWTRENLFSSVPNSALTVGAFAILYLILFGSDPVGHLSAIATLEWPDVLGGGLVRFVFDGADWGVVHANRELYFLGFFPDDETWRVWVIIYLLSSLAGLSTGLWTRISWLAALVFAFLMVPVFLFIGTGIVLLLTAGALGAFTLGYLAAHLAPASGSQVALAKNVLIGASFAAFIIAWVLLNGVESRLWSGLLLTLVLSVVGIVASFPFGVLLALGRASSFPVVRVFCTAYIEVIRAVPLITILFMALFFLPLMLEPDSRIVGVQITGIELDLVLRAMVAITAFSAAYIAENVRGGLQSVPRGQVEAAEALGLGTLRILGFIVLPQALRAVLPSLVGQFISLFKDTSLVFIMALTDLLEIGTIVTNQPAFFGRQQESLLFVALIYWIIAFSMSQASQRLERTLGVGER